MTTAGIIILFWALVVAATLYIVVLTSNLKMERHKVEVQRTIIDDQDRKLLADAARIKIAEADADQLALLIQDTLRVLRETAVLLKDKNPPDMKAELDALRLHDEAVKLRKSHGHIEDLAEHDGGTEVAGT